MAGLTFEEIIRQENELALGAAELHGPFFEFPALAISCLFGLLQKDIGVTRVFMSQFGAVRNHLTLALLSLARKHRIQAAHNLRMALESWAIAVYTMAHPAIVEVMSADPEQNNNPKKNVRTYAYAWLRNKYPSISKGLQFHKELISNNEAHGNLTNSSAYFPQLSSDLSLYETPFFDEDAGGDFIEKFGYWRLGHVTFFLIEWTSHIALKLGIGQNESEELVDRIARVIVLDRILLQKVSEISPLRSADSVSSAEARRSRSARRKGS